MHRRTQIVLVILFFTAVMLLFLTAWNSYWVDEILSVKIFGLDHNNVFSMMDDLGRNSIHPPLYQSILFFWMKLFGDSEIATRSLSILYTVGASLLIYMQVARYYRPRTGLFTVLLFSFSYMPVYYALETRSYAQTLFLSALSSYLFLGMIFRGHRPYWLMLCNLALLMTHYYNAAFVAVQGSYALYYAYRTRANLLRVIAIYTLPVIAFSLLWGYYILLRQSNVGIGGGGGNTNPVSIFYFITYYHLTLPIITYPFIMAALMFIPLAFRRQILNRQKSLTKRAYFFGYIYWLIVLIPIGAFSLAFAGKFNSRYIIYYIPPMMILIAITIEQVIIVISRFVKGTQRHYIRYGVVYMLLTCAVLVVPRSFLAAVTTKDDWRGLARNIVNVVEQDSETDYVIFELAVRYPLMDYYLARFSETTRVTGTIPREAADDFSLAPYDEAIQGSDFILVFAVNENLAVFQAVIQQLCQTYEYHFSETIENNVTIIFDIHSDEPNACPAFLTSNEG